MNFIKSLQAENKQLKEIIANAQNELGAFCLFLNSNKFTGVESDGGRKDWIATGDTIKAIQEIQRILAESNVV
jgi:hypothetical protein